MEAKKSLKAVAACALSVAMLFAGAACGTSDGSDDAASSDSGSKASELTGYDVSLVQKDDDIAKLLPDYVTKDGKLTIGMDTSYAPAEFLAEEARPRSASMLISRRRSPICSVLRSCRKPKARWKPSARMSA